tara:strand:- start:184 stop:2349 length:2166 start_codon:yes stop_codon:yes gene_type:complete
MKTFSQLNEESVDSLDKLGHKGKYNNKRLKKLARPYPAFEDFDLEEWQGYPPPKNSSTETHNEIRYLMSLGSKRKVWKTEMTMYDHKVIKPFKDYLEDFGIEVDWDRIKELDTQRSSIILSLKRHYNRVRPVELAKKMGLPLDAFPLDTADTPAYPSGHASSGRLISLLVADEAPLEHRKNILDIGQRIADSRMIAGAHYPSDTKFGKRIADELYRLSKNSSIEPDLTLEMVESLEYDGSDETEFAIDVVADIDKQIGSINGEVSADQRSGKTNSKKIGIQIILKPNERVKFTTLANDIIGSDEDLTIESPTTSRATKDFALKHKDIDRKIYVTTRPDTKRGGGSTADPNELMTAALCTMSSIPTVETLEDLDALILEVKKVVKTGKVIGYTSLEVEALENDYSNLVQAISAAEVIAKKGGWKGADKVYLTGKAWSDDVKQFQVTKYGMKDFNASDFIIKKGDNYIGISLKKKKSATTGDPTLINKGFTTLLQGKTFDKVRKELDDAAFTFYSGVIKTAQRFQLSRPKTAVDKDGNPWIGKTMMDKLGKNAKNLNSGNWKKFVTGLPNDLINYQLKKSRSLFKPMADVIEKNADLFADTLIRLILKTELKELQKVNFDFALVTGVGRMLKSGLVIESGDYQDVDTMTTKLDELFKTGKPSMKLNSKKTQAFDKGSNAAMLHMILSVGSTPVCDVTLRYKGNFASAPSFLATFSKEFKDSLK